MTFGPSGSIIIAGDSLATWGSPIRTYTADSDAFVAKLDSSGNLLWNTFLGGSGTDQGQDLEVDSLFNIYLSGNSNATWGDPINAYTADNDILIAKLDSSGNLLWSTFIGGIGNDQARGIDIDSTGNCNVTGMSTANWGSPIRAYTAGVDAFVAKLNASGELAWNTFLGGSGFDSGQAITLDSSGNVYVGGQSDATWGAPVRAYTAGNDAFIAKLNSSGELAWNTFLGGSGTDYGYAISLDSSGNVYTAGNSPATWGTPIRAYTAGNDAFVAKLNSSGELAWNTFLGGSGSDYGYAISLDSSGNVYVGGISYLVAWGSPIRAYTAGTDAFVAQVAYDPPGVDAQVYGKPAPSSPACSDQPPIGSPNLFRVDMKDTEAILYYSPFSGGNTNYYISYSEEPNSFHHGVFTGQTTATGVLSFTIRNLNPNTDYYFRLRGQNGCMPGSWGNERKGRTKASGFTNTLSSSSPLISSNTHYIPLNSSAKELPVNTQTLEEPDETPQPSSIPHDAIPTPTILGTSTRASHPPIPSVSKFQPLKNFPRHFCILWWCW